MRVAVAMVWLAAAGCLVEKKKEEVKDEEPVPAASKEVNRPEAERTRTCPGGTCMAVPEGIRGLAFGMSPDQAKQAVGRLRRRRAGKHRVGSGDCRQRLDKPGDRFVANTTIGSEKARCELWFVDGGLAVIECDLDARRSRDEHTETVWLLYQSLARQYGQALSLADQLARRGRLEAMWKGPRAELILTAFRKGRRSSIELVNRSPRYAAAVSRQAQELEARCKTSTEARLRRRAKGFEKDLRPPLERPQVPPSKD